MFQACRGYDLADSVSALSLEPSGEVLEGRVVKDHPELTDDLSPYIDSLPYRVPIYKDFLLAYATPPG